MKSCGVNVSTHQNIFYYMKLLTSGVKVSLLIRPTIYWDGRPLENVQCFKYLDSLYASHADQIRDVKARLTQVMSRCDKLRNILDTDEIDLPLKFKPYETTVRSALTNGCETWNLNVDNSRMLTRFTDSPASPSPRRSDQRPSTLTLTWYGKSNKYE